MKKSVYLSTAALAFAAATLALLPDRAETQSSGSFMAIQGSTPGASQNGHSNITGTMRAGQFIGGGNGLTSLNAANLTGIVPTASIPVPLILTGTVIGPIINGINSLNVAGVSGLRGEATSTTVSNYGVLGVSQGTAGRGVYGWAQHTTGTNAGVYGKTDSANGYGVYATASGSGANAIYATHSGTTGSPTGILSEISNSGGHAIWGRNESTTGTAYGIAGDTFSTIGRGVTGRANSDTGSSYGVYGFNQSSSGRGVYGTVIANTGVNYGVRGDVDSPQGYGVFGSGPNYGVYGDSTAASGTTYGVRGASASGSGYGVYGSAPSYGIFGRSTGASGVGSYGISDGSGGWGTIGQTNSGSGVGVLGANFSFGHAMEAFAADSGGVGVYGEASVAFESNATATGGYLYGEYRGLIGVGTRDTSDPAIGVEGKSYHPTGLAIHGIITQIASQSGVGYGVVGESNRVSDRAVQGDSDALSGSPYGVYGDTDGVGYAVYASGNSGASGTKSFRIDHPFDPENKYLLHYSTEAPEPMNFYSGNISTDGNGYAWVSLPDYFSEINRDIRYQLTVIDNSDDFVMAKVTQEVKDNRFRIRTSKGNVKVSWRVEAIRNDRYLQHYPFQTVVDKPEFERGLFEHPEIWGLGRERSQQHDQPAFELATKSEEQKIRGTDAAGRAATQRRKSNLKLPRPTGR